MKSSEIKKGEGIRNKKVSRHGKGSENDAWKPILIVVKLHFSNKGGGLTQLKIIFHIFRFSPMVSPLLPPPYFYLSLLCPNALKLFL